MEDVRNLFYILLNTEILLVIDGKLLIEIFYRKILSKKRFSEAVVAPVVNKNKILNT